MLRLFSSKKEKAEAPQICASAERTPLLRSGPEHDMRMQMRLYKSLRENVPIIDAAVGKLVRLVGDFSLTGADDAATAELERFSEKVNVGSVGRGLRQFVYGYLDQLLTYGMAVGELVPGLYEGTAALYNAPLEAVELRRGENPLDVRIYTHTYASPSEVKKPELIYYSLLNPEPGTLRGSSVLRGLPFVSEILMKIFESVGQNFDRVGNVRFAVTYQPPAGASNVNAKQRADEIAKEWSRAMRDSGKVCDFVSVGDVRISAIGADNQVLDCDVPIRHLLEQIVAKLSIPPFLLGLSWSTSERMSAQQADILTSELEYYRSLLTPLIMWACEKHLKLMDMNPYTRVEWENINLQDERELAAARLDNARARQIEELCEVKE